MHMKRVKVQITTTEEKIIRKIFFLRKEKVILDVHLAELYGVETRTLKQAVRRNMERFPKDFMFRLTQAEVKSVVSQNVIPHKKHLGGALPFAFTENGVAMLSSVLKSKMAISMNIAIMRTFAELRKLASNYKKIVQHIEELKTKYDTQFGELYSALEKLINPPRKPRQRIGFRRRGEED
jgi:translation initiation factor 2 alpha subunit (eIF-2alpha)